MFKEARIPRGSFGLDKGVDAPQTKLEGARREYDEARRRIAARGSRMHALESATDNILKAATQLETEVRKEVKYWEEILSISQKGWPLQRFRKSIPHSPLAVRYGHSEASDQFKARGIAPLRMDQDGGIILDPALALQPKTLRVRISNNGEITGTSRLPTVSDTTDLAIEKSIQLARASLFEEELYHEISLEARHLLAYRVESRNSVVHLVIPSTSHTTNDRKILIDCIARNEEEATGPDQSQDWLAQNVAEALRVLLAHEHRMRLFRRSQVPPPLTRHKPQAPSLPLLKTLLAMFSHLNAVDSLQEYLRLVTKTLENASLSVALQVSRETSWESLTKIVKESTRKDLSTSDQLIEAFVKPFDGSATLSIPSCGTDLEKITIATRTFIGPPTFGTEYKVTLPSSLVSVMNLSQDQKRDFKFSSVDDVKSYIDWLLSLDLSHTLLIKEYSRKATIRSKDPRVTISVKDGKKVFKKDVAVHFADGELKVSAGVAPLLGNAISAQTFTWTASVGGVSFKEKVKNLVG